MPFYCLTASSILKKKTFIWLPVAALMLAATLLRLRLNATGDYLLFGSDGPYYPLQVRSLLENHRLAFLDMPLLFYLEALLAQVLCWLHAAPLSDCAVLAVRCTDLLLPMLAAIPAFWLARELAGRKDSPGWPAYLMTAFTVLNYSNLFLFANSGLQKNALAVAWAFAYLYFVVRALRHGLRRDVYWAAASLALCAFTHFGTFALLLFFSGLLAICGFLEKNRLRQTWDFRRIGLGSAAAIFFLSLVFVFDPQRFERLLAAPGRLFQAPVLLLMLNGSWPLDEVVTMNIVAFNGLALFAMLMLYRQRKHLEPPLRALAWALSIFTLVLCSPLLGLEWANRFYMMAYVPLAVLYLLFFRITSKQPRWVRGVAALAFSGLIGVALLFGLFRQRTLSITDAAWREFPRIQDSLRLEPGAAMLGRHDLRMLAAWSFRTKHIADYLLTRADFEHYPAVYAIRQIKGSLLPPARFREVDVPKSALRVYSGEHFEVFRLRDNRDWRDGKGSPPTARGGIIAIRGKVFTVKNPDSGAVREVEVSEKTSIWLRAQGAALAEGMMVEVWGTRKPFSVTIAATAIEERDP